MLRMDSNTGTTKIQSYTKKKIIATMFYYVKTELPSQVQWTSQIYVESV